jgi:hypothetical protein
MFKTIAQVKKANKAAGMHFFSKDTMQVWNSRIHGKNLIGGRYFITSEQYDHWPRHYTVRMVKNVKGHIETVGGGPNKPQGSFHELADAREYANKLAAMRKGIPTNPIREGFDKETIALNIGLLMREGREQAQAVAIALKSARASYREHNPRGRWPKHLQKGKARSPKGGKLSRLKAAATSAFRSYVPKVTEKKTLRVPDGSKLTVAKVNGRWSYWYDRQWFPLSNFAGEGLTIKNGRLAWAGPRKRLKFFEWKRDPSARWYYSDLVAAPGPSGYEMESLRVGKVIVDTAKQKRLMRLAEKPGAKNSVSESAFRKIVAPPIR